MKTVFKRSDIVAVVVSIIAAVSICGCSQKSEGLKVIDIGNAYEERTPVMASEYFSSIEYVPIETSEGTLLNGVQALELIPSEDRVFIVSRSFNSRSCEIKSFDYTGKALEFKAQYGRAENEYGNVHKVMVNGNDVFVMEQSRILVYDLDGNFKLTIPLTGVAMSMNRPFLVKDREFGILADDYKEKKLFIDCIDSTGKRTYGEPVFSYSGEGGTPRYINRGGVNLPLMPISPGSLYCNNKEVFIMLKANDTLYTISRETFQKSPEYLFDYGKYQDPDSKKRVTFLLETPKFLMTNVLFSRDLFNSPDDYLNPPFIYDYATGRNRVLTYNEEMKLSGFVNDLNDDALIFMPKVCVGNIMCQLFDAIDFIDMAEKSNSSKIKEVAAKLTEESNPVLVIGTLK